jgi:site-specific DNA recombinase
MSTDRTIAPSSPTTPARAPRAAIYCRVSSKAQEDNYSLESQESDARAYAEQHGYSVAGIYKDVQSGKRFDRRQFSEVKAAAKRGEIDVVIVWKINRLGRNYEQSIAAKVELEALGVTIESVTEKLGKENTATDKLVFAVYSYKAESDNDDRIAAFSRGKLARANDGKPFHARYPRFGYKWRIVERVKKTGIFFDKVGYDVDPVTAPVVRRIFQEVMDGKTLYSIAQGLEADGIPTATGQSFWPIGTLSRMLKERAYMGEAYAYASRGASEGSEPVKLPPGTIPPLVDRLTFNKVQEKLARNKAQSSRNNPAPTEALLRGGFVKCGKCGGTCWVKRIGNDEPARYGYWCWNRRAGCTGHNMSVKLLDDSLWEDLKEKLRHPERIPAPVPKDNDADSITMQLAEVNKGLTEVAQQRQRIGKHVATLDDEEAAAPLLEELRKLADRKRFLEAQQLRLQDLRAAQEEQEDYAERLRTYAEEFSFLLDDATYYEKRSLLNKLNVTVWLYPSDRTPRWEGQGRLPWLTLESAKKAYIDSHTNRE